MKFFKLSLPKWKKKLSPMEEEFNKGNINLPTDLRDYDDIEQLKSLSPDSVKKRLVEIQKSKTE